jgi:hypothetical protein
MGFSVMLGVAVSVVAAATGVAVGRKRPLWGVLAAVGVIAAAVLGFIAVLTVSLPM